MKSNFLKTILIALLPICAVSCIDNVPEEEVLPTDPISFEYYIDQKADKYFPLVEIIAVVVFVVALISGGYIATKIMGKKNSRNKV